MKKKRFFISIILILCFVMTGPSYAQIVEPSPWAADEINQAIEKKLVYENANESYQNPIKRFEYVLLALKVLEKNGKSINMLQKYPFSDLMGHPYEAQIVQAFNAGLIKGYTDGTFKPDQKITRQEVASLVVNLVKLLDPTKDLNVSSTNYADSKEIGGWAKTFIDYCYTNGIMKGVGVNSQGLDIIDPKGPATVEQSIVLLYRLAEKEGLLKTYDLGEVDVLDDSGNSYVKSTAINQFAVTFGEKLAVEIKALSETSQIDLAELNDNYVRLIFSNIGSINITKSENVIDINLITTNLDEQLILEAYYQLAGTFKDTEQLKIAVNRSILGLKENKSFTFNQSINQVDFFKALSEQVDLTGQGTNKQTWYIFQYQLSNYNN